MLGRMTRFAALLAATLLVPAGALGQCPPAPFVLPLSSLDPCQVQLTWINSFPATGARVYRSTTNDFSTAVQIGQGSTTFIDSAVPANTPVWYWLRATVVSNITCTSGLGDVTQSIDHSIAIAPPPAPAAASYVPGCQSGTVTWMPPSTGPAPTHYDVLYGTGPNVNGATVIATIPATAGPMSGTYPVTVSKPWFWVRSRIGCVLGGVSTGLSSVTSQAAPGTPNEVAVTGNCAGINVSWVYDQHGGLPPAFTVLWTPASGGATQSVELPGTATSYVIANVVAGVSYAVRVHASNSCGEGEESAPVIAARAAAPAIVDQPESLLVSPGAAAVFEAAAAAPSVAYQWRRNGQPLVDDGRILGTRTNRLSIGAVKPEDAAMYDVVINDGSCTGASNGAVLGVSMACRADFNNSGVVTVQDLFDFLEAFFGGCP